MEFSSDAFGSPAKPWVGYRTMLIRSRHELDKRTRMFFELSKSNFIPHHGLAASQSSPERRLGEVQHSPRFGKRPYVRQNVVGDELQAGPRSGERPYVRQNVGEVGILGWCR